MSAAFSDTDAATHPGRMPLASLAWNARPAHAGVVVLVVHGGAVEGRQPNRVWSHNVIRMLPFARALAKVPGPIAVARLRMRYRGWNGEEASPLLDARWALRQLRAAYPGRPIALVGHSMGGRVALHLGDEPDVGLVLGLSPWIEKGDPRPGAGRRTVLIHGDRDVICPLWGSRRTVEEMVAQGREAALIRVARSDHAMLLRAGLWTRLVTEVVQVAFADELGRAAGDGGHEGREGHDPASAGLDRIDAVVQTAVHRGGILDL
ncbi:alpha/beta fold hydrolase [Humibacillus sp. DSM 29435]|uniref:alpha/beta fold hydrolase n=1 Tax=Humibacillus sp. DSM 29435 TaxID=1869167 RepID=UPI000AE7CA3E|nr:alpha/beta fold hydrolase [Humibacillus sp. DSM 29435]